jgi:hypothetical protein
MANRARIRRAVAGIRALRAKALKYRSLQAHFGG